MNNTLVRQFYAKSSQKRLLAQILFAYWFSFLIFIPLTCFRMSCHLKTIKIIYQKSKFMVENRPFKILCIDGGGIKGLYSATILQHWEEEFGHPISDYFDMICGTSTGGLIALGLSLKIPAKELVNFYKNEGPKIFNYRNPSGWLGKLRQIVWSAKYSDKYLKQAVSSVFGSHTMANSHNLLCIPSYNLTRGMPRVFKYPHKEGNFCMDKDLKMADVALATAAAPTYFPIAHLNNELYADGGVWANNPTLCGLLEATQYFINNNKVYDVNTSTTTTVIQFDSYQILSLSSIFSNSGWSMSDAKKRNRPFLQWGSRLFQTSMDAQNYFSDFFMKGIQNNIKTEGLYLRIPSPELSPEHLKDIDLDNATKDGLNLLSKLGDATGYDYRAAKKHLIAPFFQEFKSYQIQNG